MLLYHLERETVHHQPLQKIAETVGYSPNMLAKVKHELEAAELFEPMAFFIVAGDRVAQLNPKWIPGQEPFL